MAEVRKRVAVALLTLSLSGFAAWKASEGESPVVVVNGQQRLAPHIPTKGDVPTIGHGSTRYEDGRPVKLTDPPITRKRAAELARNLHSEEEQRFKASLPGVLLTQGELDLYLDFAGQYGIGNWRGSGMRKQLLATVSAKDPAPHYRAACGALLRYRYAAGFDCSTPGNRRCPGVWTRQQERHAKCIAEQTP